VSKSLTSQVTFVLERFSSKNRDIKSKEIISEIFAQLSKYRAAQSSLLDNEGSSIVNSKLIRKSGLLFLDSVCENRSIRSKLHDFGAVEQIINLLHEIVESNDIGWKTEFQMITLPILYKMIGDLAFFINSEYPDILNTSLFILEFANRPDFLKNLI
jgi:hypothetical protein